MKVIVLLTILLSKAILAYSQDLETMTTVGIANEEVDSSTVQQIKVLNTGFGDIIVFPAEYSIRKQSAYKDSTREKRSYFTPDDTTLLRMNADLKKQYCEALRYQVRESYKSFQKLFGDNFDKKDFDKWLKQVNATCADKRAAIDSMNKQVIGFSSEKYNGKVLLIQVIDFRKDPYDLKERSKVQMIDGWHGWFETNIVGFYYHIEQRKLSVHGDNFKSKAR